MAYAVTFVWTRLLYVFFSCIFLLQIMSEVLVII